MNKTKEMAKLISEVCTKLQEAGAVAVSIGVTFQYDDQVRMAGTLSLPKGNNLKPIDKLSHAFSAVVATCQSSEQSFPGLLPTIVDHLYENGIVPPISKIQIEK